MDDLADFRAAITEFQSALDALTRSLEEIAAREEDTEEHPEE
jgi:uncharacterized protein YukE